MNLDAYDDMMGLEFGDYEDMGQFLTAQMLQEALLASTAGGGAILLASWAIKTLNQQEWMQRIEQPVLKAAVNSGLTFVAGVAGGRALYEYNREAAMGVVGGLGGFAMAHFLDVLIAQMTGNEPMMNSLGEDNYGVSYGGDDGMAALAALETTGVTSAPGAFQGMGDATVTPEALMGLQGTVVQQETLGGLEAYQPWLS